MKIYNIKSVLRYKYKIIFNFNKNSRKYINHKIHGIIRLFCFDFISANYRILIACYIMK